MTVDKTKRTRLFRYAHKRCQRCGKSNPDYPLVNCAACQRLVSECHKRMVARWIAAGLCRGCGKEKEAHRAKCRTCLDQYNEWYRRNRYGEGPLVKPRRKPNG